MYFHDRKCLNLDRNFIEDTHTAWYPSVLTHSGSVTHMCISKLSYYILGSDNGLSSVCHFFLKKAGILLIATVLTNFRAFGNSNQTTTTTIVRIYILECYLQNDCHFF